MKRPLIVLVLLVFGFFSSCNKVENELPAPSVIGKANSKGILYYGYTNYGYNPSTCAIDTHGVAKNLGNFLSANHVLDNSNSSIFWQTIGPNQPVMPNLDYGFDIPGTSPAMQRQIEAYYSDINLQLEVYYDDLLLMNNSGYPIDYDPGAVSYLLHNAAAINLNPNQTGVTDGMTQGEIHQLAAIYKAVQALNSKTTEFADGVTACEDISPPYHDFADSNQNAMLAKRGFFSSARKFLNRVVTVAIYTVIGAVSVGVTSLTICGPNPYCIAPYAVGGAVVGMIAGISEVKKGNCFFGNKFC